MIIDKFDWRQQNIQKEKRKHKSVHVVLLLPQRLSSLWSLSKHKQ